MNEFKNQLLGTPLAGREVIELPVLDTTEKAYVIECRKDEAESIWRVARQLVSKTGRWPIITTCWNGSDDNFKKMIENEDFFSRFYFEEAPDASDVSPRGLIAKAASVDVSKFLERRTAARNEEFDFSEEVEYQLENTQTRCGSAPTEQELRNARPGGVAISNHFQMEKWLYDWELAHGGLANPEEFRLPWFDAEPVVLMFLPSPDPWDALAYHSFYGAFDGSEHWIALGKRWQSRYGAELYAHFGTMLECFVVRPPTDPENAFTVATEHYLAAAYSIDAGWLDLRGYAAGLINSDRWFLHERP